jgi:histidinol-phosphate aminotransferase
MARLFTEKVQHPYPISILTLRIGLKLLASLDLVQGAIDQMKAEREILIQELASIPGIRPFDSQGNFVLFEVGDRMDRVHSELIEEGIFVKKIGSILGLTGCLRTTVGTREMNCRLIEAIKKSGVRRPGS